jgi:hypothetical protein
MSYVYQQPSQQHNQQQNKQQKQSYRVEEAKRSPLEQLIAWCLNKASGTVLEGVVNFFVGESIVGRLATVITVSVVLGAIFELTIVSVPTLSGMSAFGMSITTAAILGAVAGVGTGGSGGAVIGALWGWLIGQIADSIAGEAISKQARLNFGVASGWIISTLFGLLAGKVTVWWFEKINEKHDGWLARFVTKVVLLIVLSALSIVVYSIVKSFIGWTHADIPYLEYWGGKVQTLTAITSSSMTQGAETADATQTAVAQLPKGTGATSTFDLNDFSCLCMLVLWGPSVLFYLGRLYRRLSNDLGVRKFDS